MASTSPKGPTAATSETVNVEIRDLMREPASAARSDRYRTLLARLADLAPVDVTEAA